MVILPVAHDEEGRRGLLTVGELEDRGDLGTAKWFRAAGSAWERHRTERSRNMDFNQRLNFQNDLSRYDFMSRFVVIYNRSGTNAVATVLETENFPLPFVANHAFYWAAFSDKNEALYLCAYLNSSHPNKLMKPFQTQGLFGARDICKKILEIPFPAYDPDNSLHQEIADLARIASEKVEAWLAGSDFDGYGNNMESRELGRFRNEVRVHLAEVMGAIDERIGKLLSV